MSHYSVKSLPTLFLINPKHSFKLSQYTGKHTSSAIVQFLLKANKQIVPKIESLSDAGTESVFVCVCKDIDENVEIKTIASDLDGKVKF